MNPPRPAARLVPSGRSSQTSNLLISCATSGSRVSGDSRACSSRSAAVSVRAKDVRACTRTAPGASGSCRSSQRARVSGRPSAGAGTVACIVRVPARRSAVAVIVLSAPGTRSVSASRPSAVRVVAACACRAAGSFSALGVTTVTGVPSRCSSRSAAYRPSCSNRPTTSSTGFAVGRAVRAQTSSRTVTQLAPMSLNSSAPERGCSRYRMSSDRMYACSGSLTPRCTWWVTAAARTSAQDRWCRATVLAPLPSLRLSTATGCCPGSAIWLEIVSTTSKPCSRATSR